MASGQRLMPANRSALDRKRAKPPNSSALKREADTLAPDLSIPSDAAEPDQPKQFGADQSDPRCGARRGAGGSLQAATRIEYFVRNGAWAWRWRQV